jgi:hypothetical protein
MSMTSLPGEMRCLTSQQAKGKAKYKAGNTNSMEKLSTVDLLIKIDCFVMKVHKIFNIKLN